MRESYTYKRTPASQYVSQVYKTTECIPFQGTEEMLVDSQFVYKRGDDANNDVLRVP